MNVSVLEHNPYPKQPLTDRPQSAILNSEQVLGDLEAHDRLLHEKSKSPPRTMNYGSTESQKQRHRDELEQKQSLLLVELEKTKAKVKSLERVVDDKDVQIQAILETLDEREKEIEELSLNKAKSEQAPATDFKQIREEHGRQIADLNAKIKTLTEDHLYEVANLRTKIQEAENEGRSKLLAAERLNDELQQLGKDVDNEELKALEESNAELTI